MRQHLTSTSPLSAFLAEVVMTSYYLAEPPQRSAGLLHDAEMKCLKVVAAYGPMQMRELAAALHVTKPRVTKLIADLHERGFTECTVGPDKRTKLVQSTPAGLELVASVRRRYQELANRIEAKLGPDKAQTLKQLLAEITPLTDFESTIKRKGMS
ncbi:winged helix-turn-helix transcriptional regulator [bacterium]|nr:MAG: winged helix-turn-helix transcriptional regulator [bacterium]